MKYLLIFEGLLAFLSCFVLACFIAIINFEKKASKLFVALTLCIGLWNLAGFLINIISDLQTALIVQKLGYLFGILIIPVFFEFVLEITETKGKNKIRILAYTLTFIFILTLLTPLFLSGLAIHQGLRQSQPSLFYHLFAVSFLFFVFVSFYILFSAIPKFAGLKRKQLKLVGYAYSICYIGGIFYFATIYKIIPIWTQAGYFISIGAIVLFYAVLQYQFLELEDEYRVRLFDFKAEHLNATLHTAKHLIEIKDIEELGKHTLHLISRMTHAEYSSFYVLEGNKYIRKANIRQSSTEIIENKELIRILEQRQEAVEKKELERWSQDVKTEDLKEAYNYMNEKLNATLIIPIIFESVIAIIILKSKDAYTQHDISNINLVAYSASITLQNILLNRRVIKDKLTGLYNREYFEEQLKSSMIYANNFKKDISFVFLDIDYFKKINDTLGHTDGDEALKQVSNILENSLRPSDIVCRWGGDEFAIIIKEKKDIAQKAMERIREYIEKNLKVGDFQITISVGITEYEAGASGKEDIQTMQSQLLKEADDNLYKAKATRNKVCISN